jgi:cytochrome d ubiquinol oxidase subunit I
VLSDVMLPGRDGVDLLRALRADETLNHVPVILLTARAAAESTVEGLRHGADDYVTKPFDPAELLARVRTHLELSRLRERAIAAHEQEAAQLETALATRTVISQAVGIVMAQQRCTPETAFEMLTKVSQNSNTKLHEIARKLVEGISSQARWPLGVSTGSHGQSPVCHHMRRRPVIGEVLASAATPADLGAARTQMALSLGWHIIIACLGVGMPAVTVFAEWRGIRRSDDTYRQLARRWARAMGVLFAVGAVSGTILSFEMGLLWPGMMQIYGEVIGLPFTLEGFAFFIEAIFLGIYLYAWDRLPPRTHVLTGIPVCVAGVLSAFFVVCANAWMNQPRGFNLINGTVTQVDPIKAMFNPATPPQTTHMIIAAFMVTGYTMAGVYAVAMLRGKRDRYHRLGFTVPFVMAALLTPVQILVGDWAAKFLATNQPIKLAALEGVSQTASGVPLHLGGIYTDGQMHYAIEIPNGLSLLAHWDPNAVIYGLNEAPPTQLPPVNVVHWSFQLMVAAGFGLLALGAWFALAWWRRREMPRSPWFLRASTISGLAAVAALEAGWVTTEVGRQPWIVWGQMRTADAVNPVPGLVFGLLVVIAVYAVMTYAAVRVLRRLSKMPLAPQEVP